MLITLVLVIISLIAYLMELMSMTLEGKMNAVRIEVVANSIANVCFLLYLIRFANGSMNNKFRTFIFIGHLLGLGCMLTSDFHSLYYTSCELVPAKEYIGISLGRGPAYYIYAVYNVLHAVIYETICIRKLMHTKGRMQKVFLQITLAGVMPYICFAFYILGLTWSFDITAIGFFLFAVMISRVIFKYGLDNTISLAKERMLEATQEAVLLVDEFGYFKYANTRALQIFPEFIHDSNDDFRLKLTNYLPLKEKKINHHARVYEVSEIPMQEEGTFLGTIYMLHEITELEQMLSRDCMTGLYNHAAFYNILEKCIYKSNHTGEMLAIAFLDIDDFKLINDRYGHDNGDEVLHKLADLMKEICGDRMNACRYGGEEFAIIFDGYDVFMAKQIMDQILEKFSEYQFSFTDRSITFSCAIKHYQKDTDVEEYFSETDKLLYKIKNSGKNKVLTDVAV